MLINGIEYHFRVASDVIRDGLGLEVLSMHKDKQTVICEVFRNDANRSYTFSQWVPDLPLELIEHIAAIARNELGDFQQ